MGDNWIALAEDTRDHLERVALDADASGDYGQARDILQQSGLLALRVPVSAGGPGGSQFDAIEVCRILGAADPGVAQLLQPHYGFTDATVMLGSAEARERVYADVLAGRRLANAASERGGRHSADFSTRFVRQQDDSYRVSGTKFYATGSVDAGWLTVMGTDQDDAVVMAYLPIDSAGLTIIDDWNGLGQKGSASGTAVLDDVALQADQLFAWSEQTRPKAWAEAGRLVHAAIDIGIAEGALRYGVDSVAATNRVPFELAQYATLADDPVLRYLVGRTAAQVQAVAALERETARTLDQAQASPGDTHMPELRAQLAATKALAVEVANQASSDMFSWTGARTAAEPLRADRFWRNARTHTLHDPVRQRYMDLGNAVLNWPQ
jgi:alkylation response protein AidB-like acyl-CoA dehydrogenase